MSASDFDDIFGDLKEDQHMTASLASGDVDEASIFGDSPVMQMKPSANKATAVDTPTGSSAQDQDEFLSWLDDGPSVPASPALAVPPPPVTEAPTPPKPSPATPVLDTVDLGDEDNDFLAATPPAPAPVPTAAVSVAPPPAPASVDDFFEDEPLDSPQAAAVTPMPPSIPVQIASRLPAPPAASVPEAPTMASTISLDDDDDDLEKIVEAAKRKAGSARESSGSSLQIKSQATRQNDARVSQYDTPALIAQYVSHGVMATPAARVSMWQQALSSAKEAASISMYAVQTTPLDLPNQQVIRKDVETMCTTIFSSALYAETMTAGGDSVDATRLLFIDNAEILVTYICKKLQLSEYPPGFSFVFGPAIAASGNDPLRLDLIATLQAACHAMMPHLYQQISPQQVADARRGLLKWLLLYHAPTIAFHLDQHFHQWNCDDGVLPDAWLSSMFESDSYRNGFDFLVKVWDCCCLLQGKASSSITTCFIVLHLIIRAEKKLIRMEGDQLRHCMAQALIDTLKDKSESLVCGVASLIESTPPSMLCKLRDAGMTQASSSAASAEANTATLKSNKSFSLISASTNGVKQVGNLVIDMPTKLLTTMVPIKFNAGGASGAATKDFTANEEFFTQLMRESTPSSSVCVTLSAAEVIPQVFRSFQAPQSETTGIRYFIIDCRASDEIQQGQIPTAFHFDPDAVTDPAVLETVLATLIPLRTTVHLCVLGHGFGYLAEELRHRLLAQSSAGTMSEMPFFLKDDFLEAFARDISRVNAAVLFLAKRGFPHVSVLDGGYAAAHTQLIHSSHVGYSVADLIDHDAPRCTLCQHHRAVSAVAAPAARTESKSSSTTGSFIVDPASSDSSTAPPPSRGSSSSTLPQTGSSATGELDAKSLFDAHASPSGGSTYFSSFTGALKNSGKAMGMGMMNPANTGSKWLMGKRPSTPGSTPASPVAGADGGNTPSPARSPMGAAALPNLSKLRNSLSAFGSEGLDMLKKAEQVATKSSQPLMGMFAAASPPAAKAATTSSGPAASTPTGGGSGGSRNGSFQRAEEEVFTIDDDEEEEQDDFVGGGSARGGGGSSRSSSSSSLPSHRNESFSTGGDAVPSTVVLHTVEKGKIKELTKGVRLSRTQMLPFVDSPFFSAYKKKTPASTATSLTARASMLPRRLVIAENHVLVLKAERNMEDVYSVKSCHHLSHLGRMTCLKKNALMVTMYYKWKNAHSGEVHEKKNAYEVQQRDELIKVIKNAMEKM